MIVINATWNWRVVCIYLLKICKEFSVSAVAKFLKDPTFSILPEPTLHRSNSRDGIELNANAKMCAPEKRVNAFLPNASLSALVTQVSQGTELHFIALHYSQLTSYLSGKCALTFTMNYIPTRM